MKLNELKPAPNSKRAKKRIGRGEASGWGKTGGRGHKGQKSRSGGSIPAWFEGGQMPLVRRLPKRGPAVTKHKRIKYDVVNVKELNCFDSDTTVTVEMLTERGMVRRRNSRVKILGDGDLDKKLTVRVHSFAKSAIEKIQKIGGKAETVS
ncbi:MAG: 50S ribosomal protein L15 [Candidatus Poribacteria bacterium]|nr:50S ribosomal protein L15 [Candidatus Poribacteria bacterium]MDE0504632.1 50S ribosomal protein L15 [Candidatus Poribacteria bacterium]